MNSESVNSTTAASNSGVGIDTDDVDSAFPLWIYVTRLEKKGKGGNVKFCCNFCNKEAVESYLRVKSHLLRFSGNGISVCTKISLEQKVKFLTLVHEAENKSSFVPVSLPFGLSQGPFALVGMGQSGSAEPKKRKVSPVAR